VLQKHTPALLDYCEGNPINTCKTEKTDAFGIMEIIVLVHTPDTCSFSCQLETGGRGGSRLFSEQGLSKGSKSYQVRLDVANATPNRFNVLL